MVDFEELGIGITNGIVLNCNTAIMELLDDVDAMASCLVGYNYGNEFDSTVAAFMEFDKLDTKNSIHKELLNHLNFHFHTFAAAYIQSRLVEMVTDEQDEELTAGQLFLSEAFGEIYVATTLKHLRSMQLSKMQPYEMAQGFVVRSGEIIKAKKRISEYVELLEQDDTDEDAIELFTDGINATMRKLFKPNIKDDEDNMWHDDYCYGLIEGASVELYKLLMDMVVEDIILPMGEDTEDDDEDFKMEELIINALSELPPEMHFQAIVAALTDMLMGGIEKELVYDALEREGISVGDVSDKDNTSVVMFIASVINMTAKNISKQAGLQIDMESLFEKRFIEELLKQIQSTGRKGSFKTTEASEMYTNIIKGGFVDAKDVSEGIWETAICIISHLKGISGSKRSVANEIVAGALVDFMNNYITPAFAPSMLAMKNKQTK